MAKTVEAALDAILRRQGIRVDYPRGVEAEVDALIASTGIDDPDLEDLTGLPFVTIDNEDSRDLDQALQIERGPGREGFIVRYALADAAHFVRPGTALFEEALERGVSYYLPRRCVPMLPPRLSEGIVSLNPRVPRRALVFVMILDGLARPLRTALTRARITSRAKLTYAGVQAHYDAPAASPLAGQDFTETLELLREVGRLRIDEARTRGVVQYNRTEVLVDLEPAGQGSSRLTVSQEARNDASCYNEQISLLCNMEGARLLAAARGPEVQAVYRIHEAPDERTLDGLERVLEGVVTVHGLAPQIYIWRRAEEGLADYLDRLPGASEREARLKAALERQVLLTNRRSVFAADPGRHFALGVNPYSRFSSPMREIVGVFTHKEALELLGLGPPGGLSVQDDALRERVIRSANRAKERQGSLSKEVMRLAIDGLLERDLARPVASRSVYQGTILGIQPTRLYVGLDTPPVELKVYVEDLEVDCGAQLVVRGDGAELTTSGAPAGNRPRFRLGDAIQLRARKRDRRGTWHLLPVS